MYDKERRRLSVKAYRDHLREQIRERLGGKCVRCGFSDARALQIDHVHGGGYHERRRLSIVSYLRRVLVDTTGKYQLLCANCNWIKKHEDNEQPCQRSA